MMKSELEIIIFGRAKDDWSCSGDVKYGMGCWYIISRT